MKKLLTILTFLFICLIISFMFWGCTLHFKGKELEIDTETKGAQIGNLIDTNHTFDLAMIDIFKDAPLTISNPD